MQTRTHRIAGGVLTGALAAALGIAGCGGAAAPTRAHTDALASIRAAEAVGVEETPQAAYHLELANEQLVVAERLIRDGKMVDAARVLERAKADADLAVALSHADDARADAEQVRQHIESLEREQER